VERCCCPTVAGDEAQALTCWHERTDKCMLQVTLYPGLLTSGEVGRGNARQFVYDERHTTLHSGPHFAQLTRLEYRLVMALLHQRVRWQAAPGQLPICLSVKYLRDLSRSTSEQSIHHALYEARQKVEELGIRVIRIYGEDRYFVLFASELEDEPLPVDQEKHQGI
jgi:hypothetical protein